jgi:PIN domain
MASLFLDANILLDFFRFGDDDISEVRKIVSLIQGQELTLYTNKQLRDEIERNREKVLAESLGLVKSTKYSLRAPNYYASFPELATVKDALKVAGEKHALLVKSIEGKIRAKELQADKVIESLFDSATSIDISNDILTKARQRLDLGNPPGKKGSLGDAVHWESLLSLQSGYGFDLVSRDGDFASELDSAKIKSFLELEWKEKFSKYSLITLFPSLGAYLRARFPKIVLSDEAAKDELIGRLEVSPNFSTTHSILSEISAFEFFTITQVNRLFEILVVNNQVGWVATDIDVFDFYNKIRTKAYTLPNNIQEDAAKLLDVKADDYFSPF